MYFVIAINTDLNMCHGDSNVNGCDFAAGSSEVSPGRADDNWQEVPDSEGNSELHRKGRGVGKEAHMGSKQNVVLLSWDQGPGRQTPGVFWKETRPSQSLLGMFLSKLGSL